MVPFQWLEILPKKYGKLFFTKENKLASKYELLKTASLTNDQKNIVFFLITPTTFEHTKKAQIIFSVQMTLFLAFTTISKQQVFKKNIEKLIFIDYQDVSIDDIALELFTMHCGIGSG